MATIYQPINLQPENISRDMSVDQNFTCVVSGLKITDYQLRIYKISDNSLLYDSTKVSLGAGVLYNGQTLSVTVPAASVANGLDLKWTMQYWNGVETVLSPEIFFRSASTATFTLDVPALITEQSITVTGTYTQAEGVPLQTWYYEFYSSTGALITRTPVSTSGFIQHVFDGLLSGTSYQVKGFLETRDNVIIETITYSFDVLYDIPEIEAEATIDFWDEKLAVRIDFGGATEVLGLVTGTSSYEDDFIYTGNKGLSLTNGSDVTYNLAIPGDFTAHCVVQFPFSLVYSGDVIKIENDPDGEYVSIGYESGRFYKDINGEKLYSVATPLTTNYYIMVIQGTTAYIYEYFLFFQNPYSAFEDFTHTQMSAYTHIQLSENNFGGITFALIRKITL